MLLNRDTAEGIANGDITVVLRRWDAPRAKSGGTQRTVAGTLRIDEVTEYPGGYRVTAAQARAAGFPTAAAAQQELDRRPARHTYVIAVSYLTPAGWTLVYALTRWTMMNIWGEGPDAARLG